MFGTARSGYNPFPGMGPPRPVMHYMSRPAATRRLSSSADLPKWARSRCNSADSGVQVDAALPAPTQVQHRRTLPGPELTSSTRWQGPEPINTGNTEGRPDTSGSAFLQQDNKLQQSMEYEKIESTTRNGGDSPSHTPLPPVQQHKAEETAPTELRPWRSPGETDVFNRGAVFGRVPLVEQPKFERPVDSVTQRQAAGNDADPVSCESGPAETGNTASAEAGGADLRPWRAPGETDIFNRGAVFGTVPLVPQPKYESPTVESPRRSMSASPRQTADRGDSLKAKQEAAPLDPPPWRHPGETDIFNRGAVFGTVPFVPQPKFERPAVESPRRSMSASPRQTADREDSLKAKQELAPLDPPPWRRPGETEIFNRGAVFGMVKLVPQPKLDQPEDIELTKPSSPKDRDDHTDGEKTNEPSEPKIWRGSETTNFNKGAMFHVVSSVPQPDFQRETDNPQCAKHPDQTGGDRDFKRETQEAAADIQPAQAPVVWKGVETNNFNKGAMFHVVSSVPQPTFSHDMDNGGPDTGANGQDGADVTQGDNKVEVPPPSQHVHWKGAETTDFNRGAVFNTVQSVPPPRYVERSTQEHRKPGEDGTKAAERKENVTTSPDTGREKGQETYANNRRTAVEEEQTGPTRQGGSTTVPPVTASRAWAGRSARGSGRDTSRPVLEPLRPTQPATGAKRPPTKWTTTYSRPPSSGRGVLRTMNDNVVGPPAGRSSPESKLPRLDSAGKPRGTSSRLRRSRYGGAGTGGGLTAVDDTVPLPEPSQQAPLTKAVRLRRAVDLPNARCLFSVEGSGSDPWKAGRHSKGKRPFPKSEYVSSFQRWFPSRHYQGTKSAWAHRAGSANSERGFAQPLPDIGSRHA